MSEILEVQWRPELNYSSVIAGHKHYRGQLELLVDSYPTFDSYRKIGNYFWAEDGPFISVYLHRPNSKDGFAGRTIELTMVDGSVQGFHGSLWGPTEFDNTSELPEYDHVAVTDSQKVMRDGHTFYAMSIKSDAWQDLYERSTLIRVNGFKSRKKICSVCDFRNEDARCKLCRWQGPVELDWIIRRCSK